MWMTMKFKQWQLRQRNEGKVKSNNNNNNHHHHQKHHHNHNNSYRAIRRASAASPTRITWCMKRRRIGQFHIQFHLQALHQVELSEWRSEVGLPRFAVWTVSMICDLAATSNALHHSCHSHNNPTPASQLCHGLRVPRAPAASSSGGHKTKNNDQNYWKLGMYRIFASYSLRCRIVVRIDSDK